MPAGISTGRFDRLAEGLYRVRFENGFAVTHYASGLEKLAFEVIFCLLTIQGTVPRDPAFGTLLRTFIGNSVYAPGDTGELATTITAEVIKCQNQVATSQAGVNLPDDERLREIVIDELRIDEATQTAILRMLIVNQLGQTVGFEIPGLRG